MPEMIEQFKHKKPAAPQRGDLSRKDSPMKKSVPPTAEGARALCDTIVHRAAALMVEEAGAPIEMIMDRFVTFAGAQTVATFGKEDAAAMFRQALEAVEGGVFDHLIPSDTIN